jgi:hypothetical protein
MRSVIASLRVVLPGSDHLECVDAGAYVMDANSPRSVYSGQRGNDSGSGLAAAWRSRRAVSAGEQGAEETLA